jgi:hypothetical protein
MRESPTNVGRLKLNHENSVAFLLPTASQIKISPLLRVAPIVISPAASGFFQEAAAFYFCS